MFLVWYGVFRFVVEFTREPDAHLGFIAWGWLTMGQLLSLPMVLAGIGMLIFAYRREKDLNR
jgi:phosphatidylglycerol:prolipoprotein diacylglycerol transferase